jgi:DNA-binding response OmpR family regulator
VNVLVVDSSATTRRLVANAVRAHGPAAITERDSAAGCGEPESPLALLVVEWPESDDAALDLIRRVRAGADGGSARIVVVTTHDRRADVERALELKVDEYLLKPLSSESLVRRVAALLESGEAGEQRAA